MSCAFDGAAAALRSRSSLPTTGTAASAPHVAAAPRTALREDAPTPDTRSYAVACDSCARVGPPSFPDRLSPMKTDNGPPERLGRAESAHRGRRSGEGGI